LIIVFGDKLVRKIFSRTWQLREEGLNEIENLVERIPDRAKAFVNSIGAVRFTLGDKMA
jgi:aspartate/tyrosine/aromatic aminotransferase